MISILSYWLLVPYPCVSAFQLFPKDSVSSYPPACAATLSQTVTSCNNGVVSFRPNNHYTQDILQKSCDPACGAALSAWYSQAARACNNVTYVNDYGNTASIASVIDEMGYRFNQTCLMDRGKYCNVVLGPLANGNGTGNASNCNTCTQMKLKNRAESPYDFGPVVYSQSIYQQYTSSCNYNTVPLTANTYSQIAETTAGSSGARGSVSAPAATSLAGCTGTQYKIRPNDTCQSIAASQGTATWWLLQDNALQAYCANLPAYGSLCIAHPCKTYTVKQNDTCKAIASSNDISVTQLRTWNPWIAVGCYNINRFVGDQVCVDQPGQKYTPPSAAIGAPTVAQSSVPAPSNVATNTTKQCGAYYSVMPGDYCDKIVLKYGIQLSDFLILNPEINANCTNLLAGQSYCVQPVGSIADYPGSPFYISNSTNATTVAFSDLAHATYQPLIPLKINPLAAGTLNTCDSYRDGSNLQFNLTGASDCQAAVFLYNITPAQLQRWNPSLKTNSSTCTFDARYRYCVDLTLSNSTVTNGVGFNATASSSSSSATTTTVWTSTTTTLILSNGPDTASSGTASSSTSTLSSTSISSITASSTAPPASTTSVTSSTTSLPASANSSAASAAPSPTQTGISKQCSFFAKAISGDTCTTFAAKNSITTTQLYQWNSVLGANGENCKVELFADYYYCTGVS